MGKIRVIIIVFAAFAAISGCIKVPESIVSPAIKLTSKIENNKEVFNMEFTGSLSNENNSTALTDLSGTVRFIDPEQKNIVETIDFTLPVILPFASEVITAEIKGDESKINSLMDFFKLSREEALSQGTSKAHVKADTIKLENLKFKKKDIVKLLKEKQEKK